MEELIGRARTGDRDALGQLFRHHHHLLLRYFRGLRAASPDDLASQVWINVAEGIGRFQGDEADFRRWLFTIARRRYTDAVRRAVRKPEAPEAEPGAGADDPTAADALDHRDALDRALELVRCLPVDMADAVMLRVVADLDVADVARIMGKSEGNVRVLVHRGLTRLRAAVVTTAPSLAMDTPT